MHYQQQQHPQQLINDHNQSLTIPNSHNYPRIGVPNVKYNSNWGESIPIQTRNNIYGNGSKNNEYG